MNFVQFHAYFNKLVVLSIIVG